MKLEYIILIILAYGVYKYAIKETIKERKNRAFIDDNLAVGSKIVTKNGVIAYVKDIDGEEVTLVTGDDTAYSYLTIRKDSIESIVELAN